MADRFGLAVTWQKFCLTWEQTKALWNDPVSRDFEQKAVLPLAEQEERTQRELERLTDVIEQARRNVR